MALGFLLAPAIVPYWLLVSLDYIRAPIIATGYRPSDLSELVFAMGWGNVGIGGAYFGAWFIALPVTVMILISDKVKLNFRVVMIMTLVFSAVYGWVVYTSFVGHYWFAEGWAAISVPGVIASGFCFYLIAVWSPVRHDKRKKIDRSAPLAT